MADDIAVKVDKVSKNFVLPHLKPNSVKSMFTGFYQRNNASKDETQHALDNISFEIKKGEFFGIVGRNGSGKSTLLKILAGIYQPTSGHVSTRGKLVPFIELGVGFNPELTGRENVFLNGAMLGFTESEVAAMYDEIVAFAELERFMDQKLKNYSSGMQVRLAFSMATRAKADILLVDEVLAVGDADFQNKCFDFFKKLKRDKKTVIFVSHDMNAVREYCDRALLIDKSKKVIEGTSAVVAGKYSELFIESSAGETDAADQQRRGTGEALITKPKIQASKDNKFVNITFNIECKTTITDPIIGYYLTNKQGQQVCGTNTLVMGAEKEPLNAGKKYTVSFEIENVLSDGTYSASIAILANTGSAIIDWWDNPVEVSIKRAQHVPYLIHTPTTFKMGEA